jgi:adenylate cyclase
MESGTGHARWTADRGETLIALAAAVIPAIGFALLIAAPDLDVRWENHPSHFWLVVLAAATTAALAYATGDAADRRGDVRPYWVSLCFFAASGFFALHALATPEIFSRRRTSAFRSPSRSG